MSVPPAKGRQTFDLDNLWRPRTVPENRFQKRDPLTVTDHTFGLIWQQGGSDFHLDWQAAHAHIESLNQEGFAGLHTWRLPTVDELVTLLSRRQEMNDYCVDPVFDQSRKWLWSCDRRSALAAWYVSMDMGFVAWQDRSCLYFVRAVCTA